MSLLKRFAFYLGGFGIGLILLYFFVGGSGASCEFDYSPNSRTKKNIRLKERIFSEESLKTLNQNRLDTSAISYVLLKGKVLFSESNTQLDSCNIYVIEGNVAPKEMPNSNKKIKITIENCNKKATIQDVLILE